MERPMISAVSSCRVSKFRGAGEFTVDAVLDKLLALEGLRSSGKDTKGRNKISNLSMRACTPPHDVIDVVAKTVVTTMGAHKAEAASSAFGIDAVKEIKEKH
nr:hypothetical protein [Tanacetum cinerariifolium]